MYGVILAICQKIVIAAGEQDFEVAVDKTFTDYTQLVLDIVAEWPQELLDHPKTPVFLRKLLELRDDFEREVLLDPLVLYKPRSEAIRQYLASPAKIRYLHSGNRFGKTAAAIVDNYYLLTGNHPYRPVPKFPSSVIAIGPDYSNYAEMVFEPKYVDGEPDSYLTPAFPRDGRWFHSYNRNTKTLRLGCAECASKLRARDCPHPKPALYLCSDKGRPGSIAGGQHGKLHIDEQVQKEFFEEGMQRLQATRNSYCDITETPMFGQAWWTYEDVKAKADDPTFKNQYYNPGLKEHVPYITVHTGSQYEGGLVAKSETDAYVDATLREHGGQELVSLRIYGEHTSLAAHKVFDQNVLREMREHIKISERGNLFSKKETPDTVREVLRNTLQRDLRWEALEEGPYAVWEKPCADGQYIIGADVAQGLAHGDNSVAHVYRMRPLHERLHLEMVAKYRGHINATQYAYVLYRLARWYNDAMLVPERNGPGHTVVHELVDELFYYNVYQGMGALEAVNDSVETRYGVTTSGESKPTLISLAQGTWTTDGTSYITTYDRDFLYEIEHYVQERSPGGHVRFHGEGSCHDDEVTAFFTANYAARVLPNVYDYDKTGALQNTSQYANMDPKRARFWRVVHTKLRLAKRDREEGKW